MSKFIVMARRGCDPAEPEIIFDNLQEAMVYAELFDVAAEESGEEATAWVEEFSPAA